MLGERLEVAKQKVGRLAMRKEGETWVAYYADNDTMEGALWLGSIHMAIVTDPDYKDRFALVMRDVVSDLIEEETGVRPVWGEPEGAPEHERSGEA